MIKNFILDILDFEFSKYWWQRSITRDYLEDSVLQKYVKKPVKDWARHSIYKPFNTKV